MRIAIIAAFACSSIHCFSQVVESNASDDKGQRIEESSILGNASLTTSANPLLPPRIGLRTYKLSANIANTFFDFYLHNNLPTFLPAAKDSVVAFSNEIINHLGGVLNIAFGKNAQIGDAANDGVKGAHYDIRAGGKFIDPPTRSYADFLVPTFQTSMDLRYLIPLFSSKSAGVAANAEKAVKSGAVGNLSFRVFGTYQKVFNEAVYHEYFKSRKGNPAPTDVLTASYEVSLFISDAFFISYGQSFANINTIPSRTMFAISYLGSGK